MIIRDGKYVYSTAPNTQNVQLTWRDNQPVKGKNSYYYVRGEQDNGEIVWVSPVLDHLHRKLMRTIIRFFSGWKLTACGDCHRRWRPWARRSY